MIYKKFKDKIVVSKEDFNIEHILYCGQIFSFEKIDERMFLVFSGREKARVVEHYDNYEIITDNTEYFENFFDLKTDYSFIKRKLTSFDIMKKPIEFGYGIRILKNNLFEMVISFIISANNNIKRIQKIINLIKEACGEKEKLFPTREKLMKLTEADFLKLGCGYRAKYLYKVLRQIDEKKLEEYKKLDTEQLRKKLIELAGVGPKVADCILLFGYARQDVFPVDTWIAQMYNKYFDKNEDNRIVIRNKLVEMFKDLSGYAQQYLFYYQRSGDI